MKGTTEEQHNKNKEQEELLDEEALEKKKTASDVPVEEQNTQLQEVIELLKRTQANFENYKKLTEKRMQERQGYAAQEGILQLLPIITNLELALKNAKGNHDEFKKGIELIYTQCLQLLEDNQIKPMNTINTAFNPKYHEALMKVESDLPENTIIEEFQRGFMFQDRVIMHAKVKVSAGRKKESNDAEQKNNTETKKQDSTKKVFV